MAMRRRFGWWTLAIGLALCSTTAPAWAVDTDGDGVDDTIDVCNNTPPGIPVDAEGRPLGDIDLDCDADLNDFGLFQDSTTGQMAPVGACCYYPGGVCVLETEAECTGDWQGPGTICIPFLCNAPADMVLVPGGEFEMGDSFGEGQPSEVPVHNVLLDPYYIDVYEVTNQQYADALNWAWEQGGLIQISAGVVYQYGGTTYSYCETTAGSSESRIEWDGNVFTVTAGKEDHPMGLVSWYGAAAYCNYRSALEGRTPCYDLTTWACNFGADGYRLPTEAEWERAAGWDPVAERHYRFSEHTDGCGTSCLDGQRANFVSSGDPFETGPDPLTTPVGYYDGSDHGGTYQTQDAQSYYGCRDMTGNVREWCHDWYDPEYYYSSPYDNPTGPASGTTRVLRGGGWDSVLYGCRSARRSGSIPNNLVYNIGLRCVTGTP